MIIDVFRNTKFFRKLEPGNKIIRQVCKKVTFAEEGEEYDLENNKVSCWFNPDYLRYLHISKYYPDKVPQLTMQLKFSLLLYFPNYISLYLINLFYRHKKDILIEDMAAGMGKLVFFLRLLRFKNFHLTEIFTQVSKFLLDEMMKAAKIKYILNDNNLNPIVINLVSWTHITREHWPESIELACIYYNIGLVKEIKGKLFITAPSGEHVEMKDFRFLCKDVDDLMYIYCRKDKYSEFLRKIKNDDIIAGKPRRLRLFR